MKGKGVFRRIAMAVTAIGFGNLMNDKSGAKSYPDPTLRTPLGTFRRIRLAGKRKVRRPLPCIPGTIVYKDWLVRELGYDRRLADGYLFAYQNGYKVKMPMPTDLVSNL